MLISVIVPVYNTQKYLRACLDSVLKQKYSDVEVICVDDGSKDSSVEILREYEKSDCRVKVIAKKNGGVSSARNVGMEKALGDWIAFIDSDDVVSPDYFDIVAPYLTPDNDAVMFSWNRFFKDDASDINDDGVSRTVYKATPDDIRYIYLATFSAAKPMLETRMHFKNIQGVVNCFYKRSIIEENNLRFSESLRIGEDQAFKISYFPYCKNAVCLGSTLYFYRFTDQSAIHRCSALIADESYDLFMELLKYVKKDYPNDKEVMRAFNAAVVTKSEKLFPIYLENADCKLNLDQKLKYYEDFMRNDLISSAISSTALESLTPYIGKLLQAFRIPDTRKSYLAAVNVYNENIRSERKRALIKKVASKFGFLKALRDLATGIKKRV